MSNPKAILEAAVRTAVRDLLPQGELPDLELIPARNAAHGDYQTSAAFKLASGLGRPPHTIAAQLAAALLVPDGMAEAEVAAGFVNFRLTDGWLRRLVREVAVAGPNYGRSSTGLGRRVQVEFVSTNPTGPLHIGHGRGAILGDTLARVLQFTGHDVEREYYVNDDGSQAQHFGESLHAVLHGLPVPENGYAGGYVAEVAEAARRDLPGVESAPAEEAVARLRAYGVAAMLDQFRATLGRLGVRYDVWYSERALWDQELPQLAIERLRRKGLVVEREGATWFAPALDDAQGEEEDRVVYRSDGTHTYFASDLGYLLSRLEVRGFDEVIEVWGADHHGYIPRIKQAAAGLGLDADRVVVILNQMVNLKEGKMSKRRGAFVTLDELIDRVDSDAVRYFYLLRSPDAMMEFDLELATSQGNENPVYYAQYAHARLANVESTAAQKHEVLPESGDLQLLVEPWELDLARQIARWPETVEEASRLREPHRIPYFTQALADRVHGFYQAGNRDWRHRVVVDDPALTRARLELARAARHTLRSALDLVGVSAPERM